MSQLPPPPPPPPYSPPPINYGGYGAVPGGVPTLQPEMKQAFEQQVVR